MTKEQKIKADGLVHSIKETHENLATLEYIEKQVNGAYLATTYGGGRVNLHPDIALATICIVRGFEESRLKKLEAEFAAL